jgi:hypothetical protein
MPTAQQPDTVGHAIALGPWEGSDQGTDPVQMHLTVAEPGFDSFPEESGGQAPQFSHGHIVGSAVAGLQDLAHRTDAMEESESLAGGALADAEALHQVVHGQWLGCDKEQSVDLAERCRLTQQAAKADEKVHHLPLDGRQALAGVLGPGYGLNLRARGSGPGDRAGTACLPHAGHRMRSVGKFKQK